MRNMLAFEVSRLMGMPYTPYATAVDVILNGEYKGCYQLCDQIEVNPNRVDIDEMTPDDNSGENLTGDTLSKWMPTQATSDCGSHRQKAHLSQ